MKRGLKKELLVISLIIFLVVAISMVSSQNLSLKEFNKPSLKNHEKQSSVEPDKIINFTIVLKIQNEKMLDSYIKQFNDKSSKSYRKFLTSSDLEKNFYPKNKDVNALKIALKKQGIDVLSTSGRAIKVSGTASSINKFFKTSLTYREMANETYFEASPVTIPLEFSNVVQGVTGLNNGTRIKPFVSFSPSNIQTGYNFTQLYNLGLDGQGVSVIIVDAYGDPSIVSDLNSFSSQFGLPQANLNIYYPDGVPATQDSSWAVETALDVEWIHAIAPNATINLVIAKDNLDSSLFDGINYAVTNNLGSVMSLSWGAPELDFYDGDFQSTLDYFNLHESFFQQAAAQGISVFVSSGDYGAAPSSNYPNYLSASYPSSSQYVTAVGGTTLSLDSNSNYVSESAWGGSGGGESYFINSSNNTSRLVPDISLDADPSTGVLITVGGASGGVGGTSLSAPIWAGTSALLNQEINGSFGLLNPVLYLLANSSNYSQDFHDVTSGNNGYYNATSGYDMVTGLGSLNAYNLLGDIYNLYLNENTTINFSNFTEDPISGSNYSIENHTFTVSISDSIGEIQDVQFFFDGINYSTQKDGTEYNVTIGNISAGNHTYYWLAKDENSIVSQSPEKNYTVNKAQPIITLDIQNSTFFYGDNISLNSTINTFEGLENFSLYINSTLNISGAQNLSFFGKLAPGSYTVYANYSGSENYTSTFSNASFEVTTNLLSDNGDGTTNLTLFSETDLNSTDNNVSVSIPIYTNVTGNSSTWNGTIFAPEITFTNVNTSLIPGNTLNFSRVIEIGFPNVNLTLDTPAKITVFGEGGKSFKVGYSFDNESLVEIPLCNTQTNETNLGYFGNCFYDDSVDIIIWTRHFTQFITYEETALPVENAPSTTSSSGGSSGGSSRGVGRGSSTGSISQNVTNSNFTTNTSQENQNKANDSKNPNENTNENPSNGLGKKGFSIITGEVITSIKDNKYTYGLLTLFLLIVAIFYYSLRKKSLASQNTIKKRK